MMLQDDVALLSWGVDEDIAFSISERGKERRVLRETSISLNHLIETISVRNQRQYITTEDVMPPQCISSICSLKIYSESLAHSELSSKWWEQVSLRVQHSCHTKVR